MIIQDKITSLVEWKRFVSEHFSITEIAKKVLSECNIGHSQFKRINIGTNAVFDLGNTILKIYATHEELPDAKMDYKRELLLSDALKGAPFRVPSIIEAGCIYDRYPIYYVLLQKMDGLHPFFDKQNISNVSEQRMRMNDLRNAVKYINTYPMAAHIATYYSKPLKKYSIENDEYMYYLQRYFKHSMYDMGIVHGDLSETNIYLDNEDNIVVLDFEDWMYAPIFVEYPTICFELLKTAQNIQVYFDKTSFIELVEMLMAGILLHNESTRFLKKISLKMGMPEKFPTIGELRSFLFEFINSRQ